MDEHESGQDNGLSENQSESQEESRANKIRLAPIDHDEYDALADLFLGSGGFAPESVSDEEFELEAGVVLADHDHSDSSDMQKESMGFVDCEYPTPKTHTPILQLARHEDDAELGGSGNELESQSGAGILETLEITDGHASDLLAELMGAHGVRAELEPNDGSVADEHDDGEVAYIEMPAPTVEVVVLGHLPVRATLWARQYACHQAKTLGETVALVRAAAGSTSIDLIADGQVVGVGASSDLAEALGRVSRLADRVILRVDEACEGELLDRDEVEEITILTGADEAAVVASYRLIKTLDVTLGEAYEQGEGPSVKVAVMGARQEQAVDAKEKLEHAANTFLRRAIQVEIGSGRIDATATSNIYRDSKAHRASRVIEGLVAAAREQVAHDFDQSQVCHRNHHQTSRQKSKLVEVEFPVGGVKIPDRRNADAASPELVQTKPSSETVEGPARERQSEGNSPLKREGLCALIPGIRAIEARCPKAPGVELGVDEQGRLVLVACDDDTNDVMNRLLAAQSWSRNNLGLLLRAEPGLSVPCSDRDEDTDATMHLLTSNPRSVRAIYDTQVRVYSLARVKIGNVIAQVATPVN